MIVRVRQSRAGQEGQIRTCAHAHGVNSESAADAKDGSVAMAPRLKTARQDTTCRAAGMRKEGCLHKSYRPDLLQALNRLARREGLPRGLCQGL